MGELSKLPNIGKIVEEQLNQVGITTEDELRAKGAKAAWLAIKEIDESACINRLMALEGAIAGVKKIQLSEEVKADLREFYDTHKLGEYAEDDKKNQIAYCGLDCEKCDAYIATINDDDALREKTAKLWSELNNVEILPVHINCEGCRADGIKTVFCQNFCVIRKCAMSKAIATCGACKEMSTCEKLSTITSNNPVALENLKVDTSDN